jgi:hypothetical protein
MSTLIRLALVALVLTSAVGSAAIARPANNYGWVDKSDPHGGFAPNSPQGQRAYLDYQSEHGN